MNNVERLTDPISVRSAEDLRDEDLCSILSEMIATVSEDRRQLRMLVYEVARRKLRTSLYAHFEDGNWAELQRQLQALELAIDKVETDCANRSLGFPPEPPLTSSGVTSGLPAEWSAPKSVVPSTNVRIPFLAQPWVLKTTFLSPSHV